MNGISKNLYFCKFEVKQFDGDLLIFEARWGLHDSSSFCLAHSSVPSPWQADLNSDIIQNYLNTIAVVIRRLGKTKEPLRSALTFFLIRSLYISDSSPIFCP